MGGWAAAAVTPPLCPPAPAPQHPPPLTSSPFQTPHSGGASLPPPPPRCSHTYPSMTLCPRPVSSLFVIVYCFTSVSYGGSGRHKVETRDRHAWWALSLFLQVHTDGAAGHKHYMIENG